jgi:hypothetical protein
MTLPATPMRFRKLRIVWSVGWGIAAVLLVMLWVRSYYTHDAISAKISPISPKRIYMTSWLGSIHVGCTDWPIPTGIEVQTWRRLATPTEEWSRLRELASGWGPLLPEPTLSFRRGPASHPWQLWTPHWICTVLAGTLAALPWLRRRFSLRTLLIATTLVAVVLGLIVWLR